MERDVARCRVEIEQAGLQTSILTDVKVLATVVDYRTGRPIVRRGYGNGVGRIGRQCSARRVDRVSRYGAIELVGDGHDLTDLAAEHRDIRDRGGGDCSGAVGDPTELRWRARLCQNGYRIVLTGHHPACKGERAVSSDSVVVTAVVLKHQSLAGQQSADGPTHCEAAGARDSHVGDIRAIHRS